MTHKAAKIFAGTQVGVARSMTPFLYQTKTLTSFRPLRIPRRSIGQLTQAPGRRFLNTSDAALGRGGPRIDSDIVVRRFPTTSKLRHQKRQNEDVEGVPWEDDAAGIERAKKNVDTQRNGTSLESGSDVDGLKFATSSDPFKDISFDENFEEAAFTSEPDTPPNHESTITIAEREAFQRIFADIMARSKAAGESHPHPTGSQGDTSTTPAARGRKAKEMLNNIMDTAVKEGSSREEFSFDSRHENKTQEELRAAVDRYPLPLRAAAAKALGLVSSRPSTTEDEDAITDADDLEPLRQPERERVEALLRAAKTDVELWQVMEAEVFSLIDRFGLGEPSKVPETKKPCVRKSKGTAESNPTHNEPLDLSIYGPLYPSHLLLSLRLLSRSFARPSPLVLNLLPRLKSLGIVSHVLGASTALYNELLRIHWTRYDDFRGAARLLQEMDQAGLDFDHETKRLVNDIFFAQVRVRRGEKGEVLRKLWALPEFLPEGFAAWRERVREVGVGEAEEVEWRG